MLVYILYLSPFVSIFSYFYMCGSGSVFQIRIRIHKAPEYGSNTDPVPDPQHWSAVLCHSVADPDPYGHFLDPGSGPA